MTWYDIVLLVIVGAAVWFAALVCVAFVALGLLARSSRGDRIASQFARQLHTDPAGATIPAAEWTADDTAAGGVAPIPTALPRPTIAVVEVPAGECA